MILRPPNRDTVFAGGEILRRRDASQHFHKGGDDVDVERPVGEHSAPDRSSGQDERNVQLGSGEFAVVSPDVVSRLVAGVSVIGSDDEYRIIPVEFLFQEFYDVLQLGIHVCRGVPDEIEHLDALAVVVFPERQVIHGGIGIFEPHFKVFRERISVKRVVHDDRENGFGFFPVPDKLLEIPDRGNIPVYFGCSVARQAHPFHF